MKKHILILKKATFGLLCLSLLTTACKKKSDDPAPSDDIITLKQSKLSGANQNPAVTTTASGTVEGTLNKTTNMLTYKISYSNLSPTGMHIHTGFAGTDGAVAITLIVSASPAQATVMLSDAQEADLLSGKMYINIHTSANAGGELRAQILTNDIVLYQNALSGANQVPAVTTTSTGTFYGTFNKSTKLMNYTFVYTGAAPNGAHIHDGLAGATGGIAFTLTTPTIGTTSGVTASTFTDMQVANLEAGKMYVNVHTLANASGEVRAQLANENVWVYNNIALSGANEVPAVTTTSSGKAYVTYNSVSSNFDYVLITNGLNAIGAHLHAGATGVAGSVLYSLTTPVNGSGNVTTTGSFTSVSAADAQTLKAGNTYINIHTVANADGELRGQVQ